MEDKVRSSCLLRSDLVFPLFKLLVDGLQWPSCLALRRFTLVFTSFRFSARVRFASGQLSIVDPAQAPCRGLGLVAAAGPGDNGACRSLTRDAAHV